MIDEFLKVYCQYLEWEIPEPFDRESVQRRLCEHYFYHPSDESHSESLKFICYGWIWGKTGDYALANAETFLFIKEIDEVYEEISRENHWHETDEEVKQEAAKSYKEIEEKYAAILRGFEEQSKRVEIERQAVTLQKERELKELQDKCEHVDDGGFMYGTCIKCGSGLG